MALLYPFPQPFSTTIRARRPSLTAERPLPPRTPQTRRKWSETEPYPRLEYGASGAVVWGTRDDAVKAQESIDNLVEKNRTRFEWSELDFTVVAEFCKAAAEKAKDQIREQKDHIEKDRELKEEAEAKKQEVMLARAVAQVQVFPRTSLSVIPEQPDTPTYSRFPEDDAEVAKRSSIFGAAGARTQLKEKDADRDKENIFPYLKLPAELRNRIYEELLHSPHPIFIPTSASASFAWDRDLEVGGKDDERYIYLLNHPIQRVSRAVRHESRSILFTTNTFVFESAYGLVSFLTAIGPIGLDYLQSIKFSLDVRGPNSRNRYGSGIGKLGRSGVGPTAWSLPSAATLLRRCKRLKRITIELCAADLMLHETRRGYTTHPCHVPGMKSLRRLRGLDSVQLEWRDYELGWSWVEFLRDEQDGDGVNGKRRLKPEIERWIEDTESWLVPPMLGPKNE